jgi:hypothetical protein
VALPLVTDETDIRFPFCEGRCKAATSSIGCPLIEREQFEKREGYRTLFVTQSLSSLRWSHAFVPTQHRSSTKTPRADRRTAAASQRLIERMTKLGFAPTDHLYTAARATFAPMVEPFCVRSSAEICSHLNSVSSIRHFVRRCCARRRGRRGVAGFGHMRHRFHLCCARSVAAAMNYTLGCSRTCSDPQTNCRNRRRAGGIDSGV